MEILGWICFGFVVGLLARVIMPGRQNMGFIMTTLLGVGGSLLGGFIANLVSHGGHRIYGFQSVGLIGSVLGAFVLLFIGGGLFRRRLI